MEEKFRDDEYNFWQTFDSLDSVGERLVLKLTEGKGDPWNMGKNLGIRQIRIFGTHLDGQTAIANFLFSMFGDCFQPPMPDVVLMVQFLHRKINENYGVEERR